MSIPTALLVSFVAVGLGYLLYKRRQYEKQFAHIPGPKGLPILKNALQMDFSKIHLILTEWGKKYGPVYKVGLMGRYAVVINGYDALFECVIKGGKKTVGTPHNFRTKHHFKDTGFFQSYPDERWKLARKIFHQYMKQFDVGLHVLEDATIGQSEEMFAKFDRAAKEKAEIDQYDIVLDTSLKIILLVICGEPISDDDPIFSDAKRYGSLVWSMLGDTSFDATLLDTFPWLLRAPLRISKVMKEAGDAQRQLASDMKRRALSCDLSRTLMGCFYQHTEGENRPLLLTEDDVLFSTTTTVFAGRETNGLTFTMLLNLLAHHQCVQDRIAEEIFSISPDPNEYVGADLKEVLPYTRATLLEALRYHCLVPLPGPKCTTCPTTICGFAIPDDTELFVNFWSIHHDKEFWGDPETFRPERFLDEDGDLVPPDHPKRRHVLPFSGGIRNCPGEQLAMSRLFIWLANTCKRFYIFPGKGNTPDMVSLGALTQNFVMFPPRFKISFTKRTVQQ